MSLSPGSKLGSYEVLAPIGAGGMGEVYRARDTRLGREVAIKVLPAKHFADEHRRLRFVQEARAASALNHPNIVTIYEIESHNGSDFIVMEYVAGKTLDALIRPGMPLSEALKLAIPMADALACAHAAGIVHRDLKPTNVAVSDEGVVKVLDFGLAKLVAEEEPSADGQTATAESVPLSRPGTVAGTVGYMSPEQAVGGKVDARSDVFAFGAVLYEMVTGRRAFARRTSAETVAAMIHEDPAAPGELVPGLPAELQKLILRCLKKDPDRRVQHMADVKVELLEIKEESDSRPASGRRLAPTRAPWVGSRTRTAAAMSIVGFGLAGALWVGFGRESGPRDDRRVTRFTVDVPENSVIVPEFNSHVALSPDGTQLAFAPLPGPVSIRRLDSLETRPLDASVSPGFRSAPLFSPDSTVVSFIEGNAILSSARPFYKAALSGGAAVKLADYDAFHRGDWASDGWIYWTAHYPGGIVRISDAGGNIEPVTELDVQRGERSHRFASLLPGEHALLYTVAFDGLNTYDDARIDLWDLRSREKKTLIVGGTSAAYSPSGHIVYARAGKLLAVPFDPSRREVTGAPFEVVDGVLTSSNTGAADFSLSRRGDLAYVPGSAAAGRRTLVWVDRSGKTETLPLPPAPYVYPRLSPDGRYLAVEIEGPNHDLHLYDFARSVLTKMTTDGLSHDPVWTPDGKRLAFRSWLSGGMTMWMMPADRSASAVRLDPTGTRQSPVSFSPDGQLLSFDQKDPQTRDDAWVLPLGGSGQPQPVSRSRFGEGSAKFSPDGRWIAYTSDESGKAEVYVQPFPGPGTKLQISSAGGFDPVWRRSGRELYYRSKTKMMVVSVTTSPHIRAFTPTQLWEGDYSAGVGSSCGMPGVSSSNYDVTADGQRFLMVRDEDSSIRPTRIVVVLNWAEELRARARAQSSTTHTSSAN